MEITDEEILIGIHAINSLNVARQVWSKDQYIIAFKNAIYEARNTNLVKSLKRPNTLVKSIHGEIIGSQG